MGDLVRWLLVALAMLGALPLLLVALQYLLAGVHGWRNHYDRCGRDLPRTTIVVPAPPDAPGLGTTLDHLIALDYPRDRVRLLVVDEGGTDHTRALLTGPGIPTPGAPPGAGARARALEAGVASVLADDWAEAVMTVDPGVACEPGALRALVRHLADPLVGTVVADVRSVADEDLDDTGGAVAGNGDAPPGEGDTGAGDAAADGDPVGHGGDAAAGRGLDTEGLSGARALGPLREVHRPGTAVGRFVAWEQITTRAAAGRARNVLGVPAPPAGPAGGVQLHARASLEALGGRIAAGSEAEETAATFGTQLTGRRVLFEPHARGRIEGPSTITDLWAERRRAADETVEAGLRFRDLWFRRSPEARGLGGVGFGLLWFAPLLVPACLIVSAAALVLLFLFARGTSEDAFRTLLVAAGLGYVFVTASGAALDPDTARRVWPEAVLFPGVVGVLLMLAAGVPPVLDAAEDVTGVSLGGGLAATALLAAYLWMAACMPAARLVRRLEERGSHCAAEVLLYVVGCGPLLAAATLSAGVHELRRHRPPGAGERPRDTTGRIGQTAGAGGAGVRR